MDRKKVELISVLPNCWWHECLSYENSNINGHVVKVVNRLRTSKRTVK